jgi:predicted TIM-barrel fold metal-dependent hydrolase
MTIAQERATSDARRDDPTKIRVVDCDVHPQFVDGLWDVLQYLPRDMLARIGIGRTGNRPEDDAANRRGFRVPANTNYNNIVGLRRDTKYDAEHVPGSNPQYAREQVLDEYGIDRAVLLPGGIQGIGAMPDADMAAALATGWNRWVSDHWLDFDDRFRSGLLIAPQDPALAVKEIQRASVDKRFCQVEMTLSNKLMGDRSHNPIYEIANDLDIPIGTHPIGTEGGFPTAPAWPGGTPTYYVEWHTGMTTIYEANLISLVANGTFERYPNLRIVFVECGIAWLPNVLWRFDKNWQALRDDLPWLKKRPSEYILERCRFTTQPMVEPDNPKHLDYLFEMIEAHRTLMFSTDYPHWDFDNPNRALSVLSDDLRQRVLVDTAIEFYKDRIL